MALARRDKALYFAEKVHRNLHGEPLEWENHYYLVDILTDPSPVKVVMSAVQTGKSEILICSMLADASLGLGVFYVLPTRDSRDVFVQNRVDRLFEQCPEYAAAVGRSLGSADSCRLKHFGPGVIRFGASESIREFKEFPADVLYVDELDVCVMNGIEWAFDRCKGSEFRFQTYIANPTFPGADFRDNIDWRYQNSDRKKLHYRCRACREVQVIEWVGNVVKARADSKGIVVGYKLLDGKWEPGCGRDIEPICLACDGPLPRAESRVGWRATGDPKHPVSGYQISRLACLTDPISELYDRFKMGLANPSKMKVFTNSDMGEPYEGGEGDRVTPELIASCVVPYEPPLPTSRLGPCSAGIDVGRHLDVRISDYVRESRHGELRRRLVHVAKLASWSELKTLLLAYRVAVAVVDGEPETRAAKDFQNDMKSTFCRVWRCDYYSTEGTHVQPVKWDRKTGVILTDRTEALDSVMAAYRAGSVIVPPNFVSLLEGRWLKEMTSSIRTEDETTGAYSWTKTMDHQLHAEAYDLLASQDPSMSFGGAPTVIRGRKAPDYTVPPSGTNIRTHRRLVHTRLKWEDVSG